MLSNLRQKAMSIASARRTSLHSGQDRQLWNLERDLKNGKITKDEAVKGAADVLGIEKTYDPHYRDLERSIRE